MQLVFLFFQFLSSLTLLITKGAGRVSEVSTFTLDALPGKQMAIDADLNAGILTPEEAKIRREEVTKEADFYGSMDGASKFVKKGCNSGYLDTTSKYYRGFNNRPCATSATNCPSCRSVPSSIYR